jgi:xanthine dehydrogenase accessory factor
MDSVDLEVLRKCADWVDEGRRTLLVTVVKTWGSSPRPEGAMLAVREDGHVAGSVSGGCIEDDIVDRTRREGQHATRCEVVTYGVSADEARRFGLPCGGTLQLVLEPLSEASGVAELLDRVTHQQLVKRNLDMESGRATLQPGRWQDVLEFDGRTLSSVHGPRWRLVLIGGGQLTRYLAEMARMLDYHVVVVDPREEYANSWDLPSVPINRGMPDDVVRELQLDGHSALVALTHDPKLDDLALMEALKSPAFYVGALGSRANNSKRRERLREFDVEDEEIARLHGPIGLYIGSRTPPEIAISILAEITAVKNGVNPADIVNVAVAKEKLRPAIDAKPPADACPALDALAISPPITEGQT